MITDIYTWKWESPCGTLLIGDRQGRLCLCDWTGEARRKLIDKRITKATGANTVTLTTPLITQAISQLNEYFSGERKAFDLPVETFGTAFQQQVWHELRSIPYGHTISYQELARRIGKPQAVRAVASVCRANAISIIIPCHRVLGKNGMPTGYAGGIPAKLRLLNLESSPT